METGGKKVGGGAAGKVGGLSNSVWEDPWKKVVDCKGVLEGLLEKEQGEESGWEEERWVDELEGMLRYVSTILILKDRETSTFCPDLSGENTCRVLTERTHLLVLTPTQLDSVSVDPSPALAYPLSLSPTFPPFSFPLPSSLLATPFPPTSTPTPSSPAQQANPSPLSTPTPIPRWYGTRLLTIVLVTHEGEYTFIERDVWVLDPGDEKNRPVRGDKGKQRRFTGRLDV